MASMLKIPLLILGAWLVDVAVKPPTPPAQSKKGDKLSITKQKDFEKYVRYWAAIARVGVIVYLLKTSERDILQYGSSGLFLLEAVLLVLLHFRGVGAVSKRLCPRLPSKEELSTMSPLFVLGMTCIYLGGFLRLWCYQALGKFFTFEISIRPGHKLITHGPYGIVRHPSYLGIALVLTGIIIAEASPNSYLTSCGVFATYPVVRWIFVGWAAMLEWFVYSLAIVRPAVEDSNLRAAFGEEWEEYHKRVPFKILPGIF